MDRRSNKRYLEADDKLICILRNVIERSVEKENTFRDLKATVDSVSSSRKDLKSGGEYLWERKRWKEFSNGENNKTGRQY